MLSFNLLFEAAVLRRDVGEGMGGFIGRPVGGILGTVGGALAGHALGGSDEAAVIGGLLGGGLGISAGGQLGRVIGRNSIENPEKSADFEKASHRVGYLARPYTHGISAGTDLIPYVGPRLTAIGSGIYNAVSDNGAARLGYQGAGKASSLLIGPLTGLVRPDKIAKNR